jgi:CRISPR-associated protein Csm5
MTVYNVTLKTLCPLHIGDGDELREGFDYYVDEKRKVSYFLNQDAILDAKENEIKKYESSGRYPPPARLLTSSEFDDKQFTNYQLPGMPNVKKKSFTPIRSFIKNGFRVPYIPGSSVKGAIRTAIGWSAWEKSMISKANSPQNLQHVDDQIEKGIFGKDPNYDLLRALQISDFTGKYTPSEIMRVAQVFTWTSRGKGVPISVEAVKGGIEFTGSIKIDDFLFEKIADTELGFSNKKDWVYSFIKKIRAHSSSQIENLIKWYEKAPEGEKIISMYRNWFGNISKLPDNQTFMQIGWGSGWDGMTYGSKIQNGDPAGFEQMLRKYKIQPTRQKSSSRNSGNLFPESRRIEVKEGKPINPFGWVQITLEKK